MKRLLITLALAVLALQGCGGGGSDSPTTPPENPQQPPTAAGKFELVAGTQAVTAPAGAPLCKNGSAHGANLAGIVNASGNNALLATAVGSNGHIYMLSTGCDASNGSLNLIEVDPSTGQMQAWPVPYDPLAPTTQPLTKVYQPAAMAVASDGSVLIADNATTGARGLYAVNPGPVDIYSAGIWRFKNGALSKVAGFDRTITLTPSAVIDGYVYTRPDNEDGTGGQATFSYSLNTMCAGPDDTFYVKGGVNMNTRKVSLNGTVKAFDNTVTFMCATNRRVFVEKTYYDANHDVFSDYSELISGHGFSQHMNGIFTDLTQQYGFGDGLTISYGDRDDMGVSLSYLILTDLKSGQVKSNQWINSSCGNYSDCIGPNPVSDPTFQLDTMPYRLPSPTRVVGIDDNNYAYFLSGNALLRYKLPAQ